MKKTRKETYNVNGLDVIITYKNIKNLYIRIKNEDASVQVSAPTSMATEMVYGFIDEKEDWIRGAQKNILNAIENRKNVPKINKEKEKELRQYLEYTISNYIKKYETVMNVKSNGFTIRRMKTRWGSCNIATHHLNFNLSLARVPSECLEYVVVHELTHLIEPSHNDRFWNTMEYYLPGTKVLRKRLNEYSAII